MRQSFYFASLILVLLTSLDFFAGSACGQSLHSKRLHLGQRRIHLHPRVYGWNGGYHASTAFEGYARGIASVVQAQGERNLADAIALRELEVARKLQLENKVLKVRTFYERREVFAQQHAAERAINRDKRESRLARIRLSDLTSEEFNHSTGEIKWPALLADEAFSDYSSWFNSLLAERAKYGRIDAGSLGEAQKLIKEWRAEVTGVKDQVSATVLRDSLRFLLRLDQELQRNLS